MACRVYRHTKFGEFRENTISTGWIASQLGRIDLEAAKGPGTLHFATAPRNAGVESTSSMDTRETSSQEIVLTLKTLPVRDVEAEDAHGMPKLELTTSRKSQNDSAV